MIFGRQKKSMPLDGNRRILTTPSLTDFTDSPGSGQFIYCCQNSSGEPV